MTGGQFSWTQYNFQGNSSMIGEDGYDALHRLDPHQLQETLRSIRKKRWADFRDEHRALVWMTGVAGVSLVAGFALPPLWLLTFLGWVAALSLGCSAISRASALGRECRFFRRSHQIARESSTYEDFQEAYSRRIADIRR